MKRGLNRGLVSSLTAIVLGLSALTPRPIYAQETRQIKQRYQTITVNRKKYYITQNKVILDEKENRVTNQIILKQVIETYILSQELPKYKQTAQQNLKDFNKSRTLTQLEELLNAYKTVLGKGNSPFSRLKGTIEALTNIYLNPKMYLYTEITSELKQAEKNYRSFIRLVDRTDLKNHRNAINLYNLLLRSEPIIKAATYSFKEIRDSKNSQLKINKKEAEEFSRLLKQKDTSIIKRKRQIICDRVKARAKRTREARNYQRRKQQIKRKLEQILKNISIKFYFNQ